MRRSSEVAVSMPGVSGFEDATPFDESGSEEAALFDESGSEEATPFDSELDSWAMLESC
jgi:hypothetical protein